MRSDLRLPIALLSRQLSLGFLLHLVFLQFVLDEFFKPSYGIWMLGITIIGQAAAAWLLAGTSALRTHRSKWVWLALMGLLSIWFLFELITLWRVLHYAWVWTFRGPMALLATLMALYCLWRPMGGAPDGKSGGLARDHRLLLALIAGTAGFMLMLLMKPVPATMHFMLPQVLALLLSLNITFVALLLWRNKKPLWRAQNGFWFVVVLGGHALPIAIVVQELSVLYSLAALAALVGIIAYHWVEVTMPPAEQSISS
jgi:hypothetical protein